MITSIVVAVDSGFETTVPSGGVGAQEPPAFADLEGARIQFIRLVIDTGEGRQTDAGFGNMHNFMTVPATWQFWGLPEGG